MNIDLPHIPQRTSKDRNAGLTMMMDKGLSIREAEDFVQSSGDFTDMVKFGFGTAVFSKGVKEKISVYKNAEIMPYFGGTLFESFIVRGMFDEYRKFASKMGVPAVEVSDGSMKLDHEEKLNYIRKLTKDFKVLSEVDRKSVV